MTPPSNPIVDLWIGAASVLFLFWYLVPIVLGVLFVSLVRNVAKTRRALERIADALELPSRADGSGVLKL